MKVDMFNYDIFLEEINDFIETVESMGFGLGYWDEDKKVINFSPTDFYIMGLSMDEQIRFIEKASEEVWGRTQFIHEIRGIGRDEILVEYTDYYM